MGTELLDYYIPLMRTLHKILGIAAICFSQTVSASILDVSDGSMNPNIILPESFETDTHEMLKHWYLKNYAVLDHEADKYTGETLSDEILLERLASLPTIIEMPLNTPVKNVINFYANRKRQLVENMLGLSLYYMPIFEEALERHNMPLELRYLPVIESALVPQAVSKAGAAGLWQFMPATGKGLGLEINSLVDQRRDPYLSSDAGARYLKQLYNTYKDWSLAIAAYNCGPGNVNKALRRVGDGKHDFWDIYPFLPAETRSYVPAFIAANYIMNFHKEHGISPALARRPVITDTVHVTRRVHFEQISEVMDIPISELRDLNPQFRADVIPGDIHPYALVLPSLQALAYIANEDSIVNHNAGKYARRGVVEPASGAVTGRDSNGEYYEEEVVKYHTVRKGENLTKIARKYGVTVGQLRRTNKIGKSVKPGRKLKIVTTQRRYKPTPAPEPEIEKTETTENTDSISFNNNSLPASESTPADSIATDTVGVTRTQEVASAFSNAGDVEKTDTKTDNKKVTSEKNNTRKKTNTKKSEQAKPKTTTHTVRKGENLSKIAKRHGVSVQAIRNANNLKNDRINVGQKLKIPLK